MKKLSSDGSAHDTIGQKYIIAYVVLLYISCLARKLCDSKDTRPRFPQEVDAGCIDRTG